MKCYYTYDEDGNKHLIPMCWGTVHSNDKEDCICSEPCTDHQFEKERFNKVIEEKNNTIKQLQSEIDYLHKLIDNYHGRNNK